MSMILRLARVADPKKVREAHSAVREAIHELRTVELNVFVDASSADTRKALEAVSKAEKQLSDLRKRVQELAGWK